MSNNPAKVSVLLTSAGVATATNVLDALRAQQDIPVRTIAVDINPYAAGIHLAEAGHVVPPLTSPDYLDRLLDICRKEEVRLVYPLYSGEIKLFAENAHRFRQANVALLTPSAQTVETCINKTKFIEFIDTSGFRYPKTYDTGKPADYSFPLFMKPVVGTSSRNTYRIDTPEDLGYLLGKHPDSILQDFIPGVEFTVDCLTHEGRLLACVPRIRLSVKDGKSMVGKTVEHPRLIAEVARLLQAIEMNGPCNVQLMEDTSGELHLIEINPRLAAGGLPLAVAAGANIPHMMLRLALGEQVEPVEDYRRNLVMVRYLDQFFLPDNSKPQV